MPEIYSRASSPFYPLLSSTLFIAAGIFLLLSPPQRLPTDPTAYVYHEGVYDYTVSGFSGGGRNPSISFRLTDDPHEYVVDDPRGALVAHRWRRGITSLSFWTLRQEQASPNKSQRTFGICAATKCLSTLAEDIAHRNAHVDSPGPWYLLVIGCGGYLLTWLLWRRRDPIA